MIAGPSVTNFIRNGCACWGLTLDCWPARGSVNSSQDRCGKDGHPAVSQETNRTSTVLHVLQHTRAQILTLCSPWVNCVDASSKHLHTEPLPWRPTDAAASQRLFNTFRWFAQRKSYTHITHAALQTHPPGWTTIRQYKERPLLLYHIGVPRLCGHNITFSAMALHEQFCYLCWPDCSTLLMPALATPCMPTQTHRPAQNPLLNTTMRTQTSLQKHSWKPWCRHCSTQHTPDHTAMRGSTNNNSPDNHTPAAWTLPSHQRGASLHVLVIQLHIYAASRRLLPRRGGAPAALMGTRLWALGTAAASCPAGTC